MSELLANLARASARRAKTARQRIGEAELRRRAREAPPPPPLVLSDDGFDLFAEVKRRSPSAGSLAAAGTGDRSAVARAAAYARAGAAAVSVLTEPDAFAGSLADLEAVARALPVPAMRKDFLVDPYQIIEARAAGASGVLFVLRVLGAARLKEMLDAAREMQLFVVLEAFDEEDLGRISAVVADGSGSNRNLLAGVNARDLDTLAVDRSRVERFRPLLPPGVPWVAESGLESASDVKAAASHGYRVALVGSALMRAADPESLAARMIAIGREALRGERSEGP